MEAMTLRAKAHPELFAQRQPHDVAEAEVAAQRAAFTSDKANAADEAVAMTRTEQVACWRPCRARTREGCRPRVAGRMLVEGPTQIVRPVDDAQA